MKHRKIGHNQQSGNLYFLVGNSGNTVGKYLHSFQMFATYRVSPTGRQSKTSQLVSAADGETPAA
jgi:hypothetical protein